MNKYLQYLLTAGSSGNSLKLCFAWAAAQGGKRLLQRGFTRQPFPSLPFPLLLGAVSSLKRTRVQNLSSALEGLGAQGLH